MYIERPPGEAVGTPLVVEPPLPDLPAVEAEPFVTRERALTTLGLGALGLVSSYAEYRGLLHGVSEPIAAIRNSGRHPLVGYIGAAIASRYPRFNNLAGFLLAGSAADIGTEAAQGLLLSGPGDTLDFVAHSQIAGNVQDYAFALGGSVLWWGRNRPGHG